MDKIFLSVLHEEEKVNLESLDMLKGGSGSGLCDGGGNLTCPGFTNCNPNDEKNY